MRPAYLNVLFFFFSSRRRHTRCSRDWSSDVCSSDLSHTRPTITRNPCRRHSRRARSVRSSPASSLAQRHLGHEQVIAPRSEEHTSELQSRLHLVCRLLLEKKNTVLSALDLRSVAILL